MSLSSVNGKNWIFKKFDSSDIKKFSDTSNLFATYGILRGAGELIKKSKDSKQAKENLKSIKWKISNGNANFINVTGIICATYLGKLVCNI